MSLILSGTNGLSDVDGSAATPAIRGTDTNTGLFFPAADTIALTTGGTERLRLDSSGNLGLGVTPNAWTAGKALQVGTSAAVWGLTRSVAITSNSYYDSADKYLTTGAAGQYLITSAGGHNWYTAASGTAGNAITFTQAMTLDASGRLLINDTSSNTYPAPLQVTAVSSSAAAMVVAGRSADSIGDIYFTTNDKATAYAAIEGSSSGVAISGLGARSVIFGTNGSERARIDSSGNLDMTGSGSVGRTAGGSGIYFGTNAVLPSTGSALSDNSKSMGNASWRWSVIYAGTGTINTSDATLKQDVQELTQAEKRVALAIKGLIRTFKFKDAVTQKGSAARIHVGVMAQSVRDAFIAEGLDANKYALFCSDTWVDEETNEEKTRLGIRYEELLAFVIAAI